METDHHGYPKLVSIIPVSVPTWVKLKVGDDAPWFQPVLALGLVESDDGHRWVEPLISAQEDDSAHLVYAKKQARECKADILGLFLDPDGDEYA